MKNKSKGVIFYSGEERLDKFIEVADKKLNQKLHLRS
jgi:hypothetical protein